MDTFRLAIGLVADLGVVHCVFFLVHVNYPFSHLPLTSTSWRLQLSSSWSAQSLCTSIDGSAVVQRLATCTLLFACLMNYVLSS